MPRRWRAPGQRLKATAKPSPPSLAKVAADASAPAATGVSWGPGTPRRRLPAPPFSGRCLTRPEEAPTAGAEQALALGIGDTTFPSVRQKHYDWRC